MPYVELHCHSNFSLLDGASHPEELVGRAAELGMAALALTDHDAVYGAPRFIRAARAQSIRPILGAELTLADGHHLTLLVENEAGWHNLCYLISRGRHAAAKGEAALEPAELVGCTNGLIALSGCRQGEVAAALRRGERQKAVAAARRYREMFGPDHFWLELQRHHRLEDDRLVAGLAALAGYLQLGCVATNNVHYAAAGGHRLQDVLVCIRHLTTLDAATHLLRPNSEYYLKPAEQMAALFADQPEALANTARLAERCHFELSYGLQDLPHFPTPHGMSSGAYLRRLCEEALPGRYPEPPERVRRQLGHELDVIERSDLANYFLIVWDIVRFARQAGIRCQGRGSAANSLVAYLLGISPIDPLAHDLVFERFLSAERRVIPDIDIDFDAQRREEVIQYVYRRYGPEHTAMACTFVTFRTRSALRDIGKALGLTPEAIAAAEREARGAGLEAGGWGLGTGNWGTGVQSSGGADGRGSRGAEERAAEPANSQQPPATSDQRSVTSDRSPAPSPQPLVPSPQSPLLPLAAAIDHFPRHLGIHSGGMIITGRPLMGRVPTEPATMPDRVVVQWDKEGLEDVGLVKIDILGLRMLSAIDEAFAELGTGDWGLGAGEEGAQGSGGAEGRGSRDAGEQGRGGAEERATGPATSDQQPATSDQRPATSDRSPAPGPQPPVPSPQPPAPDPLFSDPAVYEMIAQADTVGVFQVESRAQAQMLPRLRPASFNDLVVAISLIRPGPIQGNMVHPYLRRRLGLEPVTYLHPLLEPALAETLGVILFQEQVLKVARDLAGFTGGKGEQLRRALGAKRAEAEIERFRDDFLAGAAANGVPAETAATVFEQLRAFGGYSFAKSHAAAFAVLVYQSAWLKRYHFATFYAALLNNQPMGFWNPAVLVSEARRQGTRVLPVDLHLSQARCTVEAESIRLGFNYVKGLPEKHVERLIAGRAEKPFTSLADFCKRVRPGRQATENLIVAGAMDGWGLPRRQLLWELGALHLQDEALDLEFAAEEVELPALSPAEAMLGEQSVLGLSPGDHVMTLFRPWLAEQGIEGYAVLAGRANGQRVRVAGLVVVHQSPPTAKGFHFITLEDEDGLMNVIVNPQVYARYERVLRAARLLLFDGQVQREGEVINVLATAVRAFEA